MHNLEKAIGIALNAHAGTKDKGGMPYILHPLRLMLNLSTKNEMIVAILHDIIEDTSVTLDDLREAGFSDDVVIAVDHLTRQDNENYADFIKRVSLNRLARKVKIEDLKDNMNMSRLSELTESDFQRLAKYHAALRTLTALKE